MPKIVECVPNFSEGRRPEVIEVIRQAISLPGVTILDQHSDADHNRTVITIEIVECVPNFSEGRRPEVIEVIRQAISLPGVTILDQHSDADHNRTVITLAGEPEAIEQAAFAGIAKAAELIDLNLHRGEHPRIGATDVCPFVPVSGVSMEECVAIARRVGERVGSELNIPVYLYESAATRPERVNLENIRRGEYEK